MRREWVPNHERASEALLRKLAETDRLFLKSLNHSFTLEQLGFNKILYKPARQIHATDIIRNIVLARIANPQSKRESVNFLANNYGINLKLDAVYKAMDKLDEAAINKLREYAFVGAQSLFKEKIDVLFYDATTLYFESFTEDELKSKGFSKDKKFNEVQVLLSVFVTQSGIPVGYEVFPGTTYEGHTLLSALAKLRQRFNVNNVVFVADSGMLNQDNLEALEDAGYKYIVGARIKNMSKDITKQILDKESYWPLTLLDEEYSYKIIDLAKDKNLLVSYSGKRARKDAQDRAEAVKKLLRKMSKSKKVESVINAGGYKKYLLVNGNSSLEVNEEKIEQDRKWDGLHGVITNIDKINPQEILAQYKGLWQVEETFRISKHDLRVRPIYHWTPNRIKAHIAICFMALTCVRHLEYRVNLQQVKMSPNRIRKALTATGITILRHIKDQRLFAVPFNINDDAKIIYKTMGLKLSACPYRL